MTLRLVNLASIAALACLGCSRHNPAHDHRVDCESSVSAETTVQVLDSSQGNATEPDVSAQALAGDAGATDGGPYLSGGTWTTCHSGFVSTATPERDLTRLGMLCGPYHGMRRLGEVVVGRLRTGNEPTRQTFELKRRQCFRVFVVADKSVRRFGLKAYGHGESLLRHLESGIGWAVLSPDGAICLEEDGVAAAEVYALEGEGSFAMQVWLLP